MQLFKTACPAMHHGMTVILPGVFGAFLFYADLGFDVVLAIQLFETNHPIWGTLTVIFIAQQYVAVWLGVTFWLHAQFGIGCKCESGDKTYTSVSLATTLFLCAGFPIGPLVLDVVMFLEPLGLLHLLPPPRNAKAYPYRPIIDDAAKVDKGLSARAVYGSSGLEHAADPHPEADVEAHEHGRHLHRPAAESVRDFALDQVQAAWRF
ncbi:hypothetical protein EMIHUDRAFT_229345 [Emiliania huxleyi CCMP1516]|uniref:Uncharacterized protein n=2 Tax=Emiliania huxleyi TaxID=2903 RepID=A0A0D3KCZ6_EMIH1|nr:hypothetical protein EMIHUDRAFT_241867 [Emiliania huxleyi CCMP1516]XP_005786060.1 hypothetical protein EMIHUDRAFT_229345 [Emiliania huxleyi CCMP1516]EOD20734.1 hypothetical protein EMIHUDRAFT_241867 [Emiliania huxleyi CCMP1516]EOD33631.1 hypothetical protein EMIHUDRAFT_229345 [Emiliania huxleyi CCMP1516]|eukprot:XP_005773163.1 hypothetical protein EMIHUDRAFT_241867 [Emiliania huxleyi CCMP1516]